MVGPVMESKKHMEALARALESKTGAALVASPLSIGAYLVRLFGAKPDLAMSVVEIGVVVILKNCSRQSHDHPAEADGKPYNCRSEGLGAQPEL